MKDTVFVIFGITGELAARKLLPELLKLKIRTVGFSRRNLSKDEFQREITANYYKYNKKSADKFLESIPYFSGDYGKLYEYLNKFKKKIFYLAVPPSVYKKTLE